MTQFVRDIVRVLKMPCREHVVLLCRQIDSPLSQGERVGLRVHILYCGGCRRFAAHLRHLQTLGQTLYNQVEAEPGLPADVRAQLNARIAQVTKKN